ncbi:MAG: deoxyguanosinetriphosphate triphosphohydrolase [candidate division Zixibacteria bacterium]|nr:deoxyguanosinetriphosphate triphosphohydrolase [candidate division Zixibacteria bacterium]
MAILEKLEKREQQTLAPYAMMSVDSRGRRYKEPKHSYRTEFQRDRERIIHASSFRRLEYKTQVFVNYEGDHYRTRLTHTIEVAQIARGIARALMLNEDLAEGIALAHDLGHTPFGHSGEAALNKLMKNNGGFEHNRQSLRVVEQLESRYPDFPGLNLTYELREGVLKHETIYDNPAYPADLFPADRGTLECQVVNIADEVAYTCHDVDDGLSSGLIEYKALQEIKLWRDLDEKLMQSHPYIANTPMYRHQMVKMLINEMITDCVDASSKALDDLKPKTVDDIRRHTVNLVCRTREVLARESRLKQLLLENMYRHFRLLRMAEKAERIITSLFESYSGNPDQLPPGFKLRLKQEDVQTVVADYIAGMTDRFAAQEYKKLIDPFELI